MRNIFLSFFIFPLLSFSQNNVNDILFSIDNNHVTTSEEFLKVYNKNLDLITDQSQKNIDNYLQLYIDYKIKVLEAYDKKYDENESYISELNKYSAQLASNYLFDKISQDSLLKEAYERTKKEINADHILIKIDQESADTLDIYNKLLSYRSEFKNNKLEYLKKKYHNGKNVFVENLGYFSAFKMVYSFETKAYQTDINQVSMPFRSRFGFHIVKVNDIRNSLGQVTVGHIMIFKNIKESELTINSLYDSIVNGSNFESLAKKYSNDKKTSSLGGRLKPFTSGQLNSLPFEKAAFELQEIGQISKPIQTKFGWHILKLYSKSKLKSFNELEPSLLKKIRNNSRSSVISNSFYNKLLKKYSVSYNNDLTYFSNELSGADKDNPWVIPNNIEKNKLLFSFNNVNLNYLDFANYIVDNSLSNQLIYKPIKDLYKDFINKTLMDYYKKNLYTENENYRFVYNEYRDGLLLFDLMSNEVWNKAKEDTLALKKYYNNNKSLFVNVNKTIKPYDQVSGEVISNYQLLFENKWINSLREKRTIFIDKKVLKRIKKNIKNK
jgi:peptidyl-prolyl cis-trans isomerase SurA